MTTLRNFFPFQIGREKSVNHVIAFALHAQQRFHDQPVQPARRSRVPGPATAAGVWRNSVDIRGNDIWLCLVDGDRCFGPRMVQRIDQRRIQLQAELGRIPTRSEILRLALDQFLATEKVVRKK